MLTNSPRLCQLATCGALLQLSQTVCDMPWPSFLLAEPEGQPEVSLGSSQVCSEQVHEKACMRPSRFPRIRGSISKPYSSGICFPSLSLPGFLVCLLLSRAVKLRLSGSAETFSIIFSTNTAWEAMLGWF